MAGQLALDVGLSDTATFAAFEPGRNAEVMAVLAAMAAGDGEPQAFIFGKPDSGRSHLTQAACHAACGTAIWVPLHEMGHLGPEIIENLETSALVCLDDLDAVLPDAAWEEALFNFINAARERGTRFVVAARNPPAELGIALPDLVSRLSWGPVFQVRSLDDAGRRAALIRRARARGFDLPQEAADYILRHASRDLSALMGLLERIDRASLTAQRRVSLPFVRELLSHDLL